MDARGVQEPRQQQPGLRPLQVEGIDPASPAEESEDGLADESMVGRGQSPAVPQGRRDRAVGMLARPQHRLLDVDRDGDRRLGQHPQGRDMRQLTDRDDDVGMSLGVGMAVDMGVGVSVRLDARCGRSPGLGPRSEGGGPDPGRNRRDSGRSSLIGSWFSFVEVRGGFRGLGRDRALTEGRLGRWFMEIKSIERIGE